ncbi:MAG: hypothetical protein ACI81R_002507 [Bradymonadia bacterium]|jgi:hypothetical protein
MFKALPLGTLITSELSRIVALQRSTNNPVLSLAGGAAKPTGAWVLTTALSRGHVVYVFLRAPSEMASPGLLFQSTPGREGEEPREAVEAAALKLVTDKGFEMSPLPLDTATESEKLAWFAQLPVPAQMTSRPSMDAFVPGSFALPPLRTTHSLDNARARDPAQDAADAAKLGRLLALF